MQGTNLNCIYNFENVSFSAYHIKYISVLINFKLYHDFGSILTLYGSFDMKYYQGKRHPSSDNLKSLKPNSYNKNENS